VSTRELIGQRTRVAIREMVSGIVLRDIHAMWEAEGFSVPQEIEPIAGQRVSLFEAYLRQVDWTSNLQVARATRVLQDTLAAIWEGYSQDYTEIRDQQFAKIKRQAERDGLVISDDWLITPQIEFGFSLEDLSKIQNPESIYTHLDRLSRGFRDYDPESVIGQSKELIETTAKLVLDEVGVDYDPKADVGLLVKTAQRAIGLDKGNPNNGPDSLQSVRQILNGARSVATGLAELRNSYGTGHGPGKPRAGLEPRHAQLAVNSARLWCDMMLSTYASETAPWRQEKSQRVEKAD